MTTLVTSLLLAVCAVLSMPVLLLFVQVVCGLGTRGTGAPSVTGPRRRVAVLVPAHDESIGILPTLQSVRAQLAPGDRCLVVADNCSDDTAAVALAAGAEVVERTDAVRRGKGFALDFGMHRLADDAPDVVIIVDADCIATPGSIERLTRTCAGTNRPVQALYLMRAPAQASRSELLAEFAWRVKNWARPLGFRRLRLPCPLMGSGMAFPFPALRAIDLASGHLVEDVKMGIDLVRLGYPPQFCPQALVTSTFPSNQEGAKSQRTRWEHGHLAMILHDVPSLLVDAVRRRSLNLLMMTLDLAVPPLALLVMLFAALFCLAVLCAALGISTSPLVLMLVVGALFVLSVTILWARFGADIVPLATLAFAGLYALRKIPLYVKFIVGRQVDWVKSRRDAD